MVNEFVFVVATGIRAKLVGGSSAAISQGLPHSGHLSLYQYHHSRGHGGHVQCRYHHSLPSSAGPTGHTLSLFLNHEASYFLSVQAVELGVNPLYFMIPATVSASYAFMLPVATPPNAMAFSYGYLKVYHMVSPLFLPVVAWPGTVTTWPLCWHVLQVLTGVLMNLLCVGIVTLFLNTTGRLIFHLDTFPSWATNITSPPVCLQWTALNSSIETFYSSANTG